MKSGMASQPSGVVWQRGVLKESIQIPPAAAPSASRPTLPARDMIPFTLSPSSALLAAAAGCCTEAVCGRACGVGASKGSVYGRV